jgi:hypothetical protein
MEKVLNLANPIISTLPYDNHLLAIIGTLDYSYPWVMSNYIQLCAHCADEDDMCLCFYKISKWNNCPYVIKRSLDAYFINKEYFNIIDFIENAIEFGYYVVLTINMNYITQYNVNFTNYHQMMVYGFNNETHQLNIADFFQGYYSYTTCSYEEFKRSYYSIDRNSFIDISDNQTIDLLLPYPMKNTDIDNYYSAVRGYSLEVIKTLLSDYLYSYNTNLRYGIDNNQKCAYGVKYNFGISVIDILTKHVSDMVLGEMTISVRSLHIFYEHKKLMVERLKFIKEKERKDLSSLIENYDEVLKLSLLIRNIGIKYNMTKRMNLKLFLDYLEQIKDKEETNIKKIISVL